jgi:hypothetical protein
VYEANDMMDLQSWLAIIIKKRIQKDLANEKAQK